MQFVISVHHEAGVLVAQAQGTGTLAALCGLAAFAGASTARSGERRVVLDLMDVAIELAFTDHLQLGSFVAQQLQHAERVASIVPERYRTGTSEKAAQKGGLLLRTFTNREQAFAWVREDNGI